MGENSGQISDPEHESAETAVLVIDMITDFEFEDGDQLFQNTLPIAPSLGTLISDAHRRSIPVIYVNDNFGKWQEDFSEQVELAKRSEKGRQIVEHVRPTKSDYYVLKPQRSAFYETPLALLLASMHVRHLTIVGVTTDICVLFSAHDAYMRGFKVRVPGDCTSAVKEEYKDQALDLLARVIDADVSEYGRGENEKRGAH